MVQANESEHKQAVEQHKFSVVGRLFIQRGMEILTTFELKEKLVLFWGFRNFKLIAMGKDDYHVIINNVNDQSIAMSAGPVFIKPEWFRVSR